MEQMELPVSTGLMEQMEQLEQMEPHLHLAPGAPSIPGAPSAPSAPCACILVAMPSKTSTVVRQATTQLQALHREGQRGLRQGKHHSSGKGCRVTSSGQP